MHASHVHCVHCVQFWQQHCIGHVQQWGMLGYSEEENPLPAFEGVWDTELQTKVH